VLIYGPQTNRTKLSKLKPSMTLPSSSRPPRLKTQRMTMGTTIKTTSQKPAGIRKTIGAVSFLSLRSKSAPASIRGTGKLRTSLLFGDLGAGDALDPVIVEIRASYVAPDRLAGALGITPGPANKNGFKRTIKA